METWKDVSGFEGKYQVSNLGRVKSLARTRNKHHYPEKILNTTHRLTKDGYARVTLRDDFGINHEYRVNKLVALTYLPNPSNKETVNHKDGNKLNNEVTNLEWATRSENMKHAYRHNLKKPMQGQENANAKLSDDEVRQIRKSYIRQSKTYGTVALARKYGVTPRVIGQIVRRISYKNVQ